MAQPERPGEYPREFARGQLCGRVILPGSLTQAAGKALCRFTVEVEGSPYTIVARGDAAQIAACLRLDEWVEVRGHLRCHRAGSPPTPENTLFTLETTEADAIWRSPRKK